jgi:hypothetical protein
MEDWIKEDRSWADGNKRRSETGRVGKRRTGPGRQEWESENRPDGIR